MSPLRLRWLGDATLRAAPHLRLLRNRTASPAARQAIYRLRRQREFAGLLIPNGSGLKQLTAVNSDGARLWIALKRPNTLRAALPVALDEGTNTAVSRMLLDGLLELEHAGTFVSGIDAFPLVFEGVPSLALRWSLGRLGVRALRHATRLGHCPATIIASHLYRYNWIPGSAERCHRFRELDESAAARREGWVAIPPQLEDHWSYWVSRDPASAARPSNILYKLYISPAPDHLRAAFRVLLGAESLRASVAVKIGRGLVGVLRPDKLVAYFRTATELREAARELSGELTGMPAHGVPFTGSIRDRGLLSWGVDPMTEGQGLAERQSWRQWVTERLGRSLAVASRSSAPPVTPWQFSVYRLILDGVSLSALSLDNSAKHFAGSGR